MTARAHTPQDQTDPLAEPVVVGQFWRNRRGECIRVTLKRFEGRPIVDVRLFYTTKTGHMQPTAKGVALVILRLPDLATCINRAVKRAAELGLLPDEAAK